MLAVPETSTPLTPFTLRTRELRRRQGHRCYLCGAAISKRRHTEDHVWPKCLGGQRPGNILLACLGCNQAKDDRRPYACELLYRDSIYCQGTADGHVQRPKGHVLPRAVLPRRAR